MATLRYKRNDVCITTYAGAEWEKAPNSQSRTRIQMSNHLGQMIQFNMDQWIDLICFIREMDARNEGITSVPEVRDE